MECRAKTEIVGIKPRMLRFLYSLVLFRERVIVRALLDDGINRQNRMTMLTLKEMVSTLPAIV